MQNINKTFDTLNLSKENISNLTSLGYVTMTPIQQKSLPYILDKKDVVAKANTGSGKTVAFSLGVLDNLDTSLFRIQALILAPTRELASQITQTLKKLARYRHNIKILQLTGGVPYKPQVHSLSHQAHIVVGTPGRVLKHLEEKNFTTNNINTFVLDEADRMLEMGFIDDIKLIYNYLPQNIHTMFFSATFPQEIEELTKDFLKNPIKIETLNKTDIDITEKFYKVEYSQKSSLLLKLFDKTYKSIIIFCNTKQECDTLADTLEQYDLEPLVLHSDLEQKYRDETLILFSNKSYPILIATDVASRGLDITDVDMVVNYDIPNSYEIYTHRVGRTARAGKSGIAITFIEDISQSDDLFDNITLEESLDLFTKDDSFPTYEYSTLYINGGKKDKLRAGDILGALTAGLKLDKNDIGKIDILPTCSYVAIKNDSYEKAFKGLNQNKMKNRYFKVYRR